MGRASVQDSIRPMAEEGGIMKLVYIAGPFTPTAKQRENGGDAWAAHHIRENILRATNFAIRVAESGHMPVCPHSNTSDPRFLSLQTPAFWYAGTLELMRRCDAIALTDDWQDSNGACREVIEAARMKLMVWESGNVVDDGGWCLLQWSRAAESALRSRGEAP